MLEGRTNSSHLILRISDAGYRVSKAIDFSESLLDTSTTESWEAWTFLTVCTIQNGKYLATVSKNVFRTWLF